LTADAFHFRVGATDALLEIMPACTKVCVSPQAFSVLGDAVADAFI